MHIASYICNDLFRRNPTLRLAWRGAPKQFEGQINSGAFYLVKLKPLSEVGDLADPITFCSPWYVQPEIGEDGTMRMVKADLGPIFSRKGECRPDWDPLFFVPVIRENLEDAYAQNDAGISGREYILRGLFLSDVLPYTYSKKDIYNQNLETFANDTRRTTDDMGREMGKEWWNLANKRNDRAPLTTKEERVAGMKWLYEKKEKTRIDNHIRAHKL